MSSALSSMSIVLLRDHTFLVWAPNSLLDRISYYRPVFGEKMFLVFLAVVCGRDAVVVICRYHNMNVSSS